MNHVEDDEQIVVADYLNLMGFCWWHTPNGGKRNAREATRMKRMGVKAGVSDVIIADPPLRVTDLVLCKVDKPVGFIGELKRPDRKNNLTKDQQGFLNAMFDRGWAVGVYYGANDMIDAIQSLYDRRWP